jgi:triose/dihydroxyacetone kinase / FAD-AMP lyase (cyclizing)
LALSNGTLARVDGHSNIVVRSDYQSMDESVAIIAIGGAGHEPAHSAFVGPGMLCAAVCGGIFASPSINAILIAILLVTEEHRPALLIVKNYSGDRRNAGVAVEKAKAMGIDVEILLVADDISIEDPTKRRGIAGVVFLHKLAGYLSQQGYSLEEIKHKCEQAASDLVSLSVTLSGADSLSESTAQLEPQLGRGIHNEAGQTITLQTEDLAKESVELLTNCLSSMIDNKRQYAVLINNLGALTHLEMGIITQEILNSTIKDRIQLVVGPAPFVTQLNAKGFSISLLVLNEERKKALLSPVTLQAWVPPVTPLVPRLIDISLIDLHSNYTASHNEKHFSMINEVCQVLVSSKDVLNALDAKGGDGDSGSTLAALASHIQNRVSTLPLAHEAHLFQALGDLIASVGGGTMGALLSVLCTRTGIALETGLTFAEAIATGAEAMSAGTEVGARSLLDSLIPAIEVLGKEGNLHLAAEAARAGANATMTQIATVGRAANVSSEVYLGFRDSGAEAVALVFERLAEDQ